MTNNTMQGKDCKIISGTKNKIFTFPAVIPPGYEEYQTINKYMNTYNTLSGKRFLKYQEKMADSLCAFLTTVMLYDDCRDLTDVTAKIFQSLFFLDENIDDEINSIKHDDILQRLYDPERSSFSAPKTEEGMRISLLINEDECEQLKDDKELERFLTEPYEFQRGGISYRMLTKDALEEACRVRISREISKNGPITEDNYFLTLPEKSRTFAADVYEVATDLFTIEEAEIFRLFSGNRKVNCLDCSKCAGLLQSVSETNAQKKEKEREAESLSRKVASLEQENSRLKEMLNNSKEPYINKLEEEERKLSKLQKNYDQLLEKYTTLKQNAFPEPGSGTCKSDKQGTSPTCGPQELKIDHNGRYVFLVDKEKPVSRKLAEEFPNSLVTQDIFTVKANTMDLVVVLTQNIGHSAYNKVRYQCKIKDVPFVHCPYTNLEQIEKMMASALSA